jgi:Protein of unknown function (DUF3124)
MKRLFRNPMRWRTTALASLLVFAGLSCGGTGPPVTTSSLKTGASRPGVSEVPRPAQDKIVASQVVYVPVYSHVYTADNAEPLNLAATLYVRNTDRERSIILTGAEYFDSDGKRIRDFLPSPLRIGPLAAVDFFVKENDVSGGAAPSFLVQWVATEAASDPVVESVMIGTMGTQGISFTSPGRVIQAHKP